MTDLENQSYVFLSQYSEKHARKSKGMAILSVKNSKIMMIIIIDLIFLAKFT